MIRELRARIAEIRDELRQIDDRALRERRTALTAAETTKYAELRAERERIEARIDQLEDDERRRESQAAAHRSLGTRTDDHGQPRFYASGGDGVYARSGRHSYFQDLAADRLQPTPEVRNRLMAHAQEMDNRLADPRAATELRGWATPPEQRVNPNRVDGQGGYFVPPAWLIDEYITLARFGRATADLAQHDDLPAGTDSINIPRIATGTATAIQTADAAAVSSVDFTDAVESAPVRTIAGQQDVSLQLLEQSPISLDRILFADLISDYNQKLDIQVLNGSGASGQVLGVLNVSGVNAITYTDATPTLPEFWVPMAQAVSKVYTQGKVGSATAVVIHPAVWGHWLSQLDTTGRPLMSSPGSGPMNTLGNINITGDAADQGVVGNVGPMALVVDGNIPSNLGAGTNETRMITAKFDESYLWESTLRTRVMMEVLSGTLQVRLQVYAYCAFLGSRRPACTSIVSGTGLIPVSGF